MLSGWNGIVTKRGNTALCFVQCAFINMPFSQSEVAYITTITTTQNPRPRHPRQNRIFDFARTGNKGFLLSLPGAAADARAGENTRVCVRFRHWLLATHAQPIVDPVVVEDPIWFCSKHSIPPPIIFLVCIEKQNGRRAP